MIPSSAAAMLSAYALVAFGAEAATVIVLWRRAALESTGAFGILAAAYAVATVAVAINAAVLLGALPLDPSGPVSWLWWHTLIPIGVLFAVRFGDKRIPSAALAGGTLTAAAVASATLFERTGLLHALDDRGALTPVADVAVAVGIVLAFAALVALARDGAFAPSTRGWIAVAVAAVLLDEALTMLGGARFSPLWFAARALGLIASAAVLFGYVYDTFGRVAQLEGSLREMRVFRDVAQTLPHLVWAVNGSGELEWCNDRWYAYTGQMPDSARGSGWREVYHPHDAANVVRRWLDAIARGEAFQTDVRVRGRNGTYRWFQVHARPLRDANHTAVRWFVSHTDVDEARREAQELAWRFTTNDALTADRARPAFVAYLAAHGIGGEALQAAEAVFGELVGNVVRHAPGPIEVDLRQTQEGYLLAVRDRGTGFVGVQPQLPNELAESGRGLYLVSILGSPPAVRSRPDGGAEVCVLLAASA